MEDDYPSSLLVDFNKLTAKTLRRYAVFFNLPIAGGMPHSELAALCAHHFAKHLDGDEESAINNFTVYFVNLEKRSALAAGLPNAGGSVSSSGADGPALKALRRDRDKEIAPGRRVAAKIHGDWLLTRVMKFKKRSKMYKVEDADELTTDNVATYEVPANNVLALQEPDDPDRRLFPRGSRVLALFPRTSTFYAATVVKRSERGKDGTLEYGLRFDDDEKDARGEIKIKMCRAQDVVEYSE